jgi:uncharacterized protein
MLALGIAGGASVALGQVAQAPTFDNIGPSFNCDRVAPTAPLALIVCADSELRRLDVAMVQPYFSLAHLRPDPLQEMGHQVASVDEGHKLKAKRNMLRGARS